MDVNCLKSVPDPERFGVANLDNNGQIVSLEEKPKNPKSNLVVTGFYIYDNSVFSLIKTLKPSKRNELEITEVNNIYVKNKNCIWETVNGEWTDSGTFESLYKANTIIYNKSLS